MPSIFRSLVPGFVIGTYLLVVGIPAAISAPAAADSSLTQSLVVQPQPPLWSEVATTPVRIPLARTALILSLGGLAALIAHDEDDPADMVRVLDQPLWEFPSDLGNTYGNGWVIGGVSLAVFSVGKLGGHESAAALGGDMCESLLLTGAVSTSVKYAVNRQRPSGGGLSFPSGHTAAAFSLVPVLGHHLGWKVAVPAMIIAGTTAAGRMEDMHHFLSDVVFGAAVGLACGDLVSGDGFLPLGNARLVATPDRLGVSVPF